MKIDIFIADYLNEQQAEDIGFLLNAYAKDPMGQGSPLNEGIKEQLAMNLSKVANAFSVLCYVDGEPAGLTNCFQGFSTFKCKPLINIHDLIVRSEFRGLKISQQMLAKVDEEAIKRDCCKVTLEVLEGNKVAQNAYLKFGYEGYVLDPKMGKALFWEKPLPAASLDK